MVFISNEILKGDFSTGIISSSTRDLVKTSKIFPMGRYKISEIFTSFHGNLGTLFSCHSNPGIVHSEFQTSGNVCSHHFHSHFTSLLASLRSLKAFGLQLATASSFRYESSFHHYVNKVRKRKFSCKAPYSPTFMIQNCDIYRERSFPLA